MKPSIAEPVIWQDVVGVSVNANSLTKTSPDGWGNAGAASVQVLAADGEVTFEVEETNTARACGFSAGNTDADLHSIDFAILLGVDGSLQVIEEGNLLLNAGAYQTGDVFGIARRGSQILYKRNGITFFTSTCMSPGPLLVDCALFTLGATLKDVTILGSAQEQIQEVYEFQWKAGTQGTGDGQFYSPFSIATDSQGFVYVVDPGDYLNEERPANCRVQKFSSSGRYIAQWGQCGSGEGEFRGLLGLAVDADDNIYTVEEMLGRVQKFDKEGNFIQAWAIFSPHAISIGPDGFLYIIQEYQYLNKYDQNLNLVATLLNEEYLADMAIDLDGNIFVTDWLDDYVYKLAPDGSEILRWGGSGTAEGQFRESFGITIDGWGKVLVADRMNHRIQKFDDQGNFITQWGRHGTGDGEFQGFDNYNGPVDVHADGSGCVYASDTLNYRIQKFCLVGPFIRGDANQSGIVDIADAIFILQFLFRSGQQPFLLDAADANNDERLDIADAVYILLFLFSDEVTEMPAPFPEPGFDTD